MHRCTQYLLQQARRNGESHEATPLVGYWYRDPDDILVYVEGAFEKHPDELVKGVEFVTQGEREIYEGTPWGYGFPMVAHLAMGDCTPRHQRIELIRKRLDCSWESAKRLLEAFKVLELDSTAANAVVDEIRGKRTGRERHERLTYYEMLASEMEALKPDPEGESEPGQEITWMGEYTSVSAHGPHKALLHYENRMDEENGELVVNEVEIDLVDLYRKRKGLVPVEDEETVGECMAEEHGDTERILADLYQYHRANPEADDDWVDHQPKSFHTLLKAVADCKILSDLSNIGKLVHAGKIHVTKDQSGFFWVKYNSKKTRLERKLFPGRQGNALLDRIWNCTTVKELRLLGKRMFDFQSGSIPGCTMDSGNWTVVWKQYKRYMAVLEGKPIGEALKSAPKSQPVASPVEPRPIAA